MITRSICTRTLVYITFFWIYNLNKEFLDMNKKIILYIILFFLNLTFYLSCQNASNEAPSNNKNEASNNNSTEIEIVSLPQKMSYLINETLDLKGLEIHKKVNGNSTAISKDEYVVEPAEGTKLTELGTKIVKITAYNQVIYIVINISDLEVENIVLNTSLVKRYYGLGETLDLSTLRVSGQYSDETIKEINNYSSIPEDGTILNTLGMQTVSIIAEGKKASFDIQVLPDSNIEAQVIYEVYSDIPNLLSYDSITKTFTALPNYDSYRWFVDDKKQNETSNRFVYLDCKYHTITVIVNAAGANYSAQLRIE